MKVHELREPEVAQLDPAASANEHVVRLDVPMDNAVVVQVVQGLHQLGSQRPDLVLSQLLVSLDDVVQLAVLELGHQHELVRLLE
jgi:hypothetical protein